MAVKGNLRDFSLVQLLNLINLAKKTGALCIEGNSQSIKLYFREGKLAYVLPNNAPTPLLRIMSRAKLIPSSLAASLGEKYRNSSDQELGIFLINSGYISQEQIFSGIESFLMEVVRGLFTWTDGVFYFSLGELPPDQSILVHMDLENIIIEGSRQQNELEDLKNEIPSLDMSLKFTERPGLSIRNVSLNAEEWRVVSYVNPKNSIQQIAGAAKLNDFQIRRVVYNLLQAGLVELVRPSSPRGLSGGRMQSRRDPLEQKSLVNRVIDRIKLI